MGAVDALRLEPVHRGGGGRARHQAAVRVAVAERVADGPVPLGHQAVLGDLRTERGGQLGERVDAIAVVVELVEARGAGALRTRTRCGERDVVLGARLLPGAGRDPHT